MTNEELYYLPASELLKHIQAEKERLIREKVIKKSPPLPPITKEEKPYELPENWEWIRLGEIGITQTGTTPKTSNPEYYNGSYSLLKPNDIYENYINYETDYKLTDLGLKNGSIIEPNSIVMVCIGSIGKSNIVDRICSCNQQINYVKPYISSINSKYLLFALNTRHFKIQLENQTSATTVKIINKSRWENLLIPLPPLYIQDQIVQKLEQLSETKDSLLSHAESQLNYTKKMREALLQEAIRGELVPQDENDEPASVLLEKIKAEKERLIKEKVIKKSKSLLPITEENQPFSISKKWVWCKLNDISFVTKLAGFEYTKNIAPNLVNEGVPLFKGKNIQNGEIIYEFEGFIPKEISESLPRSRVTKKCLLTPYVGTIGNIALHEKEGNYHLGSNVGKIEFFNENDQFISVKYILYYLRSNDGFNQLIKHKKSTAQESISIEAIRDVDIPLPPLAQQERIVAKLDELMAHCDQLEIKAEEMKKSAIKLFETSLKEAFMPE